LKVGPRADERGGFPEKRGKGTAGKGDVDERKKSRGTPGSGAGLFDRVKREEGVLAERTEGGEENRRKGIVRVSRKRDCRYGGGARKKVTLGLKKGSRRSGQREDLHVVSGRGEDLSRVLKRRWRGRRVKNGLAGRVSGKNWNPGIKSSGRVG